jgi:plastocyanin
MAVEEHRLRRLAPRHLQRQLPPHRLSVFKLSVTVGQNGALAFSPNSIVAAVGSQVEFIYFPPTHSVVQAAFDAPCQPINDTGFFSGSFTTSSGPNVRCSVSYGHLSGT